MIIKKLLERGGEIEMFKKFITGFATGSLILLSVSGTFASTSQISGNGAESKNEIEINNNCTTYTSQKNKTSADITVNLNGNTGKNTASGNTGGDVSIDTGSVTNTVIASVSGGNNTIDGPNCCCDSKNSENGITISDNGANSNNEFETNSTTKVTTKQKTKTWASIGITAKGNTGKNKAKKNTNGTTSVTTSDVDNSASVTVEGGHNTL